jgi:hypothetical protein
MHKRMGNVEYNFIMRSFKGSYSRKDPLFGNDREISGYTTALAK